MLKLPKPAVVGLIAATILIFCSNARIWSAPGQLLQGIDDPALTNGDDFGKSIAIVANNILVGSPGKGANAGAAYLFDGTTHKLLKTIDNPNASFGDYFGTSVAALGNHFIIGAPGENTVGAAYLIDGDPASPTYGQPLLTINNPGNGDEFGSAVASVGGNILVGDPNSNTSGMLSGSAYLFDGSARGTTSTPLLTINNPVVAMYGYFGVSLAGVGGNILIGASITGGTGAAFLFDGSARGTTSTPLLRMNPPSGKDGLFGVSVAAFGNDLLIGSSSTADYGAVYLFDGSARGTTSTPLMSIYDPAQNFNDQFGTSVGAVGSNIIVGSPFDDTGQTDAGVVYVFDGSLRGIANSFKLKIENPAPFYREQFGNAVAGLGDNYVIGAFENNINGATAGSIYLFGGIQPGDIVSDVTFEVDPMRTSLTGTVTGEGGMSMDFSGSAFGFINATVIQSKDGTITGLHVYGFDVGTEDQASSSPFAFNLADGRAMMGSGQGSAGGTTDVRDGSFDQSGNAVALEGTVEAQIGTQTFYEQGEFREPVPTNFQGMIEQVPATGLSAINRSIFQITIPVNLYREIQWGSGPFNPQLRLTGVLVAREVVGPIMTPTPTPTVDDASPTGFLVPTEIPTDHEFPIQVTMMNTGNTTWSHAAQYKLGVETNGCGLFDFQVFDLPIGAGVGPNESFTFTGTLFGPFQAQGPCSIPFRMQKEDTFFGTAAVATINVIDAVLDAQFVANTIPLKLAPGEGVGVGITLLNTGNTYWKPGQDILRVNGFPCTFSNGGQVDVRMDDAVPPNQTYQFITYITAPTTPGTCNLSMQMNELGFLFGDTLQVTIAVEIPPNASRNWALYE